MISVDRLYDTEGAPVGMAFPQPTIRVEQHSPIWISVGANRDG